MKKPVLLDKNELLSPINQAIERIEKIRIRKASNTDSIILEGLFLLAVSSFENSIFDTMRILYTSFPEKMKIKNESIPKEDLLNKNPVTLTVERKVLEQSYKSLDEYLNHFFEVSGIRMTAFFDKDDFAKLIEIKATRNLLTHNNLKINSFYTDTAGKCARNSNGSQLEINQDYLFDSIVVLKNILTSIRNKLVAKFKDYTRLKALRELFEFTFKTPIMKFDNEWEVDEEADRIIGYKKETSRAGALSSSERMFFSIWLSHICGSDRINLENSFYKLDSGNREKFGYLIEVIDILKS